MVTRHRIPTIFNLSMVDVLCCALGCVILLWLLNLREAKLRAVAAGQTSTELTQVRNELEQRAQDLTDLRRQRDQASSRADALAQERDQLRAELKTSQAQTAKLEKSVDALRNDQTELEGQLTKKAEEARVLNRDLAMARQRNESLETMTREKDAQARAATRSASELAENLRAAEERFNQLKSQSLALEKEISERKRDLMGTSKNLLELEDTNARLLKELADGRRQLASADQRISTLQTQAVRAREAVDNRFAGLALTGRRIVFLVDMSASMMYVDEQTEAPGKWLSVRETLTRIMRSLPEMEKYQVILFSDKLIYPLGQENQWLDYDARSSVDRLSNAIGAIKPSGNTDMYAAFEAAFRLRSQGLDTIYVFSDGLPNRGAGLTLEASRQMKDTERADVLSKYVRKTLTTTWNRSLTGNPRVRINTVGFFYESPDVGAFLWALAREHDGGFVGMSKP